MPENNQIDDILRDIEGHKVSNEIHPEDKDVFTPDAAPITDAIKRREEQVKEFSLNFDADSVVADVPESNESSEETSSDNETHDPSPITVVAKKEKVKQSNKGLNRLLYALLIIIFSVTISLGGIIYFFEASGLQGTDTLVDVEITQGAYTAQIADILKDKGLINNTLYFRLYAKFAKADSSWQVGTFMLSSNMGYAGLVEELQKSTPRANVDVTIPEGYTLEEIARLLADKEVCTETDFYNAAINGTYDYDFIKAIPSAENGKQYAGRIYRLEGYLFPDTYNFYLGSSGEMVINKMLANFNRKLTPDIRKAISEKGWNIDEAITFASIVQGEAGKLEDMYAVSKVLTNRLQPNSGFSKLQCDATRDYIRDMQPNITGIEATTSPYDTYIREGLPVGAINNPGLHAIDAALNPSTDELYATCYYFATDYSTGITYYSKTLKQHEAICRRYKIGMYG